MSVTKPDQLPEADPTAIARAIVLRKLSASAKTRAELARVLAERNVPEDVAQSVLDRFCEVGLIDDQMYAQIFARSRHEYKGLAPRAISYQLAAKGVAKSEIDAALDEITPEMATATATAIAQKKLASMKNVAAEKKLDRLVSFLSRKGYSASTCYQVAKSVLAAELTALDIGEFD